MNINIIALSTIAVFITIISIIAQKPLIRLGSMIFLLFIIIGSTLLSIDIAARRVIGESFQSGLHTIDFDNGVRSLLSALTPVKVIVLIYSVCLFLISLRAIGFKK